MVHRRGAHLGNPLSLYVLDDLLRHAEGLWRDVAEPDLVEGEQSGQGVDRAAMLKISNHSHLKREHTHNIMVTVQQMKTTVATLEPPTQITDCAYPLVYTWLHVCTYIPPFH